MNWKAFFDTYGDCFLRVWFFEQSGNALVEELYQAFKQRLLKEI